MLRRKKMENPNNVKRTLRVPKDLYEHVKNDAKRNNVSVNQWIVELLEKSV
jgi:predicted HicB family RNase H-like nuclease